MRLLLAMLLAVGLMGCDVVAPNVSKAITERQQLEELKQQNELLERIANALENR